MSRRSLRVAAYAVCLENEEVLLARWVGPSGKRWTLPGGGLDHGEDPLDAAVREVYEETGYQVTVDSLLGVDSIRRNLPGALADTDWHGLRVIYAATIAGGELRFEEGGSTDMAAWVPLAEVATLDRTELVDTALELARTRPPTGRLDGILPA
ncbi:NUDIX hydrolase [Actinokineospora sp. PR83]|uniref:NUDIX hydrolase n=1 Tax=Actinokineospora sp. PR83 TaxID=2884908 RepID=UPI001F406DA5|nr:NUDIX hydrolase [Actinokineospora sp. PR83]MCG8918445.1 NUDIX hydrolase [Actinokineospora sp. PR83]